MNLRGLRTPTGREANQLAIYKRGRGVELGATENNSSECLEWDFNPGPPDFKCNALTTRSRCLHYDTHDTLLALSVPNSTLVDLNANNSSKTLNRSMEYGISCNVTHLLVLIVKHTLINGIIILQKKSFSFR